MNILLVLSELFWVTLYYSKWSGADTVGEPETLHVQQTCKKEDDNDGVNDGKPVNLNITHS